MLMAALAPAFALLLSGELAAPAQADCPPRPMPSPLEVLGEAADVSDAITFAATPSLKYPGHAWVVRLGRPGNSAGTIEIARLRRQLRCNWYDVEHRWKAPLRPEEYRSVAEAIAAVAVSGGGTFSGRDPARDTELVIDGTVIDLRQRSTGWEVRRRLNHYGAGGAVVSAVFHELVRRHVPAPDVPTEDWRERGSR